MPYWLIEYEGNFDVVEASDQEQADMLVYSAWHDWVQSQADFSAKPLTSELAEDHGFSPENYGLPPVEYDDA